MILHLFIARDNLHNLLPDVNFEFQGLEFATYDGIGFHKSGVLVSWAGIPTTFSLYAFCYCAHPIFLNLYTSMKKQKQFSKVMLLCFVFSTITYA